MRRTRRRQQNLIDMAAISARVRGMIEQSHDGSVLAASKEIGCAYDPLNNLARGINVHSINLSLLVQVADYYNTTTDWIITGRNHVARD